MIGHITTIRRALALIAWTVAGAFALPSVGALAEDAAPSASVPASKPVTPAAPPIEVVLHTEDGDIVLALDAVHAPITTANFLHYVDQKRFDGARFYRNVPIGEDGTFGMLQGGLLGTKSPPFKAIAHESTAVTGLHHTDGAISMGRNAPGTAQSEFFIVMGDLSSLDANDKDPGYAAFGHVESGMDLVRHMIAMPHAPDKGNTPISGQLLDTPVKIISARRVTAAPTH